MSLRQLPEEGDQQQDWTQDAGYGIWHRQVAADKTFASKLAAPA